jgi:DNA polymerase (family 10)
MDNKQVAKLLNEIGAVLEIKGENPFKVRAYYRAARALEGTTADVNVMVREDALRTLPGVGEAISKKVAEYVTTGKLGYYEKIREDFPVGLLEMLRVPDLGPRKISALHQQLGISGLHELQEAAQAGKLKGLPGFGARSEEKVLQGIEMLSRGGGRTLLGDVLPQANAITGKLGKLRAVSQIAYAGSVRRMKETVKDLAILVTSTKPEEVMDRFAGLDEVDLVKAKGDTKSSVILKSGLPADLRVVARKSFGAALQYFTGSKDHNVHLRGIAQDRGLKLNEYGLFRGRRQLAGKTEEEVYGGLSLPWCPPELREDTGEVEAAQKGKLPDLVEAEDIRGMLHVHTDASDGMQSLEEIADACAKLGYEYVVIADHSESAKYAGGLSVKQLLKQMVAIDKLNKKRSDIRIFKGAEVDIRPDGLLDYGDEILSRLDFVVAGVHSNFRMGKKQMTARIQKALANRQVDMFAHPTGRLLLSREPYQVDMEELFKVAKKYRVILELNCQPERMDLDGAHCRAAREMGIKIAIATDAHNETGLAYMELGVGTARRGWLSKSNVVNCLSASELIKSLKMR